MNVANLYRHSCGDVTVNWWKLFRKTFIIYEQCVRTSGEVFVFVSQNIMSSKVRSFNKYATTDTIVQRHHFYTLFVYNRARTIHFLPQLSKLIVKNIKMFFGQIYNFTYQLTLNVVISLLIVPVNFALYFTCF